MRSSALIALLLLPLGCSTKAPRDTNTDAHMALKAEGDSSAEASPCAPACEGGALRSCDRELKLGAPEPCPEGSACLVDRCVGLAAAEGSAVPLATLQSFTGGGWINTWAAAGPFEAEALPDGKLDAPLSVSGISWRAQCSPGPMSWGRPRTAKAPKTPDRSVMTTFIVSARSQEVLLKTGAMGNSLVALNGKEVERAQASGRSWPFDDERVRRVSLNEGVNTLSVRMDQDSFFALGAKVRFADLDNRALTNLRVANPLGQTQGACAGQLIDAVPGLSPTSSGATYRARMSLRGAVPQAAQISWKLTLLGRKDKTLETLGGGALSVAEMSNPGGAEITVDVPATGEGSFTLLLEVGADKGLAKIRTPVTFRKDLLDGLARLMSARALLDTKDINETSLQSLELTLSHLENNILLKRHSESSLKKRSAVAASILTAMAAKQDPYPTLTGLYLRAYRSEVDGKLQPYAVYVPPSYKRQKNKDFPLIVAAHGLGSIPEKTLVITMGNQLRDRRAIIVAPWGFKNSGQRLLGEHDTLRVIEEMRRTYRIDPLRISITGASLGGTVAWVLPLHHPDVFSASAPLCGYPNLQTYNQIEGVERRMPWEETLIQKKSISNYAANAMHTRVRIIHGGRDAPERSAVVSKAMRRLGVWHIFDIQKELGHNVWDYAYEDGDMLNWLRWRSSPGAPTRNRLVTADYRYDRSRWLRLIESSDYGRFASIDATVSETGAVLEVKTDNVDTFEVDLSLQGQAIKQAVVDNGTPLAIDAGDAVVFQKSGGVWTVLDKAPSLLGKKRRGVAGPLDDVQTHPQLIVYGTADPGQTAANLLTAEHLSGQDRRSAVKIPVRADSEVSPEELRLHSLILVGSPASNTITRRFAEHLPAKFDETSITLGAKRHEGPDVGVSLIYPHPLNPDEYLVLHAGVGIQGTLASRHLPELVPDYVVYDRRLTHQRWAMLMDRRETLDGGFFDETWALRE